MPDEEVHLDLVYGQRGDWDATSRIDRVSDALARMKAASEAAGARLAAMSALGLFDMPSNQGVMVGDTQGPMGVMVGDSYDKTVRTTQEVERQTSWWSRIRDLISDIGQKLGPIGDFIGDKLGAGLRSFIEGLGDALSSGPMSRIPVLGAGFSGIGSALESMGPAGAAALPVLLAVAAAVLLLLSAVVSLVAFLTILTATTLAAAAVLSAFAIAGAGTLLFLGLMGGGILAAAAGIIYWGIALQGGTTAAATLATTTKQLQTAQEGLDASQLALAKWWANNPFGPQNQSQVLTLQGLMDRLRDSQDKLKLAQDNYNQAVQNGNSPLQTLIANVQGLLAPLNTLATSISNTALAWVNSWVTMVGPGFVGAVQGAMGVVNDRMLPIMSGIGDVIRRIAPDLNNFGAFLTQMFDRMSSGGRWALFQDMGVSGIQLAIQVIETLLGWLEQLTNWFLGKGPDGIARFRTYGQIVIDIFSGVAGFVVGTLLPQLGRFTDWLVANWPNILKQASDAVDGFKKAWDQIKPAFDFLISTTMPQLSSSLQDLAKHSGLWLGVLFALFTIILGGITVLFMMANFVNGVAMAFKNAADQVANFIDKMSKIPVVGGLLVPSLIGGAGNGNGNGSGSSTPFTPGPRGINITNNFSGVGADPTQIALVVARTIRQQQVS